MFSLSLSLSLSFCLSLPFLSFALSTYSREERPDNDIGPVSRHSASNMRVPTLIVYIISLSHGHRDDEEELCLRCRWVGSSTCASSSDASALIYATVPTWCSERGHPCPLFTIHFFFWPVHLRKNAWDESGVETPYVFFHLPLHPLLLFWLVDPHFPPPPPHVVWTV